MEFCKTRAEWHSRETMLHGNSNYFIKDVSFVRSTKRKDLVNIRLQVTWNGFGPFWFNYTIKTNLEITAEEPSDRGFTTWGREFLPALRAWLFTLRIDRADFPKRLANMMAATIKEELAAAVWAPARVERLLAAGGWDAIDGV